MDCLGDGRGVGLAFDQIILRTERTASNATASSARPVSTTIGRFGAAAASRPMVSSPCESGNDRSSKTASNRCSQTTALASSRVATLTVAYCRGWRPSNMLCTKRASPALSSTRRRCWGMVLVLSLICRGRKLHDRQWSRNSATIIMILATPSANHTSCELIAALWAWRRPQGLRRLARGREDLRKILMNTIRRLFLATERPATQARRRTTWRATCRGLWTAIGVRARGAHGRADPRNLGAYAPWRRCRSTSCPRPEPDHLAGGPANGRKVLTSGERATDSCSWAWFLRRVLGRLLYV